MALTPAQLTTLNTDIVANSGVGEDFENIPATPDGDQAMADLYNLQETPDFTVWRTGLVNREINETLNWSEIVLMNAVQLTAINIFKLQDVFDMSIPSMRAAFGSVFPTGDAPLSNAALIELAKRLALRIEKVLATGTGSNASPAIMSFENNIDRFDIRLSRNL